MPDAIGIRYDVAYTQLCITLTMRPFLTKATELGVGWNERELSESDLDDLCRRYDVGLAELPLRTDGFYYRVMGRDMIVVNSLLRPRRRLFVAFHELAHCLFHVPASGPSAAFFHVGRRDRREAEADAFALIALMPLQLVLSSSIDELVADGHPRDEVASRHALYRSHGI